MKRTKKVVVLMPLVIAVCMSLTTAQAALVSEYNFENSGINSVSGAPTAVLEGGATMPTYVAGAIGSYGVNLDNSVAGNNNRVDTGATGRPLPDGTASLGTGTFSTWIKTTTTAISNVLYATDGDGTASETMIKISINHNESGNASTGGIGFMLRTDVTKHYFRGAVLGNTSWLDGQWHQITIGWQACVGGVTGASVATVYLDGQQMTVTKNPTDTITSTDVYAPWYSSGSINYGPKLGSNHTENGSFLTGSLDDVSVWNTMLSDTYIKALYSVGKDSVLNYGAGDAQALFTIFEGGPGASGQTSDGTTWEYATGLTGAAGSVSADHTYLVLDGINHTGVRIIPEASTFVLLTTSALGLLAYAWRKRK